MTKINLSRRVMDVLHQSGYKNEYFISDFEYSEILEKYEKFGFNLPDSVKEVLRVFGGRKIIYDNGSIPSRDASYEMDFSLNSVLGKLKKKDYLMERIKYYKQILNVTDLIPISVMPSGPMEFFVNEKSHIYGILDNLILFYKGNTIWESLEKVLDGDDVILSS